MKFFNMDSLKSVFNVSEKEWKPVIYSFLYFFCLMSSYFILRPVRDEMGIQAGVENMQWLFTGTFIVMLLVVPIFGYLLKKVRRTVLIPGIYIFFSLNILLFYATFQWLDFLFTSSVFFIWLSVFNLFVISIFWSFNSDIFNAEQAKRLYGPIAGGGSTGAIIGPVLTSFLVGKIGINSLLLISTLLLILATVFIHLLIKNKQKDNERSLIHSSDTNIWSGIKMMFKSPMLRQVGMFILFYTTISTFLYFEQAHIISNAYSSSSERTAFFGTRDLLVNTFTLLFQFFLTERIIRRWGVAFCLMLVPLVAAIGFMGLALSQSVILLLIVQVIYRSLSFAVQRPAREVLFTTVSVNERYKSKNFIDTAVYRGGDAISGWLFAGLASVISSLQVVALLTVPIAVGWLLSGRRIGKIFSQKTIKFNHDIQESNLAKKSA